MTNGITPHATSMQNTPMQNIPTRPPLPTQTSQPGPSATPVPRPTPKPVKTTPKPSTPAPGSNLPAPPLDDVHAALSSSEPKRRTSAFRYNASTATRFEPKNTSRQRQHLQECTTYLNVIKEAIPANNLLHRFDEGDICKIITTTGAWS